MAVVDKKDCIFGILIHQRVSSVTDSAYQIEIKYGKQTWVVTHGGILRDRFSSTFAGAKFFKTEAQKFIDNLPDRLILE